MFVRTDGRKTVLSQPLGTTSFKPKQKTKESALYENAHEFKIGFAARRESFV